MESQKQLNNPISEESASVQTHLQILQSVTQRMANNSASCKTWCITMVSAILVLVSNKGNPDLAWLAILPTVLFLSLDSYYLALEKAFRASYNSFVKKLHSEKLSVNDLYSIVPKDNMVAYQIESLKSFSIWGFYSGLVIMIMVAREWILG